MFFTDEAVDVTLLCDNCCMNDVVGMKGLLQNRVIISQQPPFLCLGHAPAFCSFKMNGNIFLITTFRFIGNRHF